VDTSVVLRVVCSVRRRCCGSPKPTDARSAKSSCAMRMPTSWLRGKHGAGWGWPTLA